MATYAAVALVGFQPYDAVLMIATIPLLYLGAGRSRCGEVGPRSLPAGWLPSRLGAGPGEKSDPS